MRYLLTVFFYVFLFACTSNRERYQDGRDIVTIDLNNIKISDNPSKLSDFVESISYIRLDDEPLISDLIFASVIVSDETIYVDEKLIYKYTLDGKFIKSLFKKGQGPGEATKLTKGAYDLENGIVAVYNNMGTTYRLYTLEGEHIGDTPKVDSLVWLKNIISYINGNEVFYYSPCFRPLRGDTVNYDGPNFIYVKDLKSDSIIYKQPNYHYDIKAIVQNGVVRSGGYPLSYGFNDKQFWWKNQSVDTIYCTSNFKDVRPCYVIKKSKSFADYEFCVHRTVLDIPQYDYGRRLISMVYPLENGILYCVEGGSPENSGAGFCRNNGRALTYSMSGFVNDIDEFFKNWKPYGVLGGGGWTKDGYLYALMDASDFFEEGCKPPFSDLTEESNPVIMKLKLKKYEK